MGSGITGSRASDATLHTPAACCGPTGSGEVTCCHWKPAAETVAFGGQSLLKAAWELLSQLEHTRTLPQLPAQPCPSVLKEKQMYLPSPVRPFMNLGPFLCSLPDPLSPALPAPLPPPFVSSLAFPLPLASALGRPCRWLPNWWKRSWTPRRFPDWLRGTRAPP